MTSTPTTILTVSGIWHEAVTRALAYPFIITPKDEKAARREMAVVDALLSVKAAGLRVEVAYSATPDAASKTYYRHVGRVLSSCQVVSFTDQGAANRGIYAFVVADGLGEPAAIPVSTIFDLQDPPHAGVTAIV